MTNGRDPCKDEWLEYPLLENQMPKRMCQVGPFVALFLWCLSSSLWAHFPIEWNVVSNTMETWPLKMVVIVLLLKSADTCCFAIFKNTNNQYSIWVVCIKFTYQAGLGVMYMVMLKKDIAFHYFYASPEKGTLQKSCLSSQKGNASASEALTQWTKAVSKESS